MPHDIIDYPAYIIHIHYVKKCNVEWQGISSLGAIELKTVHSETIIFTEHYSPLNVSAHQHLVS